MKKILSGNEAFARGAYEAGVKFVSSYPGTPSTEITENISKYDSIISEWATNEKVATEAVLGASISGRRALTCMKHVGLNLASEPLMTGSYTGVNAGVVMIVADDPNMYSSQNEQDSRNYARFAKVPMLEPSNSQEAKDFLKLAFDISEEFSTPVIVRSVTRLSHSATAVEISEPIKVTDKEFEKNTPKWVMVPANARRRHVVVEERLLKLIDYSSQMTEVIKGSRDIGIITSGVVSQYVKEALPDANILRLKMVYPLPLKAIEEFAKTVKKLYIVEELDRFFETELKAHGIKIEQLDRSVLGELSVEKVRKLFNINTDADVNPIPENLPNRPPTLCPGCSHRGIFYAISKLKLFSFGDIGCYTLGSLPPLAAINTTVCMGSGISMAHGADIASDHEAAKNSVAVIGDSTFFHTGLLGLINSVYNKGHSTVVILDNRITGMTGHQPNPATGYTIKGEETYAIKFDEIVKAIGVKHVLMVNPFDSEECVNALKEAVAYEGVSVVIANKPCIFADRSVQQKPYHIIDDKCTGCKICTRLGCPSIMWDPIKRKARIDQSTCTGCDLCHRVCRFDCIVRQEEKQHHD